jgi:predicted metal-binding protein
MPFEFVKPVVNLSVRKLCIRPYPLHPKGCPNYNKKEGCPPKSLIISKILNLNKKCYVIWNVFNFDKHCQRMKQLHPNWKKKQVECCLYWQNKARNQLELEILKFRQKHPNQLILKVPESHGVNVTATMKKVGIELEWPPKTKTYQVAIAGVKLWK